MSQSPAAGSSVDKGSSIGYVISLGSEQVLFPSVVGYTRAGAISAMNSVGIEVSVIEQSSSSVAEGLVISQSISAGTYVSDGSTITIVVSSGSSDDDDSTSTTTNGATKQYL
jgi:serine/threonine-protein kinase